MSNVEPHVQLLSSLIACINRADLVRAPGRGRMQRRLPEPCAGLDIGAAGQQYLDDGGPAVERRGVQGAFLLLVPSSMSAPAAISSSYPLLGMQVLLV
jgi:hypothetical protein